MLDGFAATGDHPLDRYQRAYFQSTVEVSATASGGSVVRVRAKVTAWYSDTIPSRSGYQLLTSNGRLEGDLLDQLSAELHARAATSGPSHQPAPETAPAVAAVPAKPAAPQPDESAPSAPVRRLPETGGTFSSTVSQGLAAAVQQSDATPLATNPPPDHDPGGLKAEAESLEEILKNETHPKNLVAVKKSGTPVVATASLTAKTLFMASAHDEFEMLDFNADWVHVRISGLSRGWIWRNSLEMPEGIPDVGSGSAPAPAADDFFRVTREETASFPGDWEPLRNKSCEDHFRAESRRGCQGHRPESKTRICEIPARQELQGLGWKNRPGGSGADFRFGRWRHDRYYPCHAPAMEGGQIVGRRSLAPILL